MANTVIGRVVATEKNPTTIVLLLCPKSEKVLEKNTQQMP